MTRSLLSLDDRLVDARGERAASFGVGAAFRQTRIRMPDVVQVRDGFLEWKDASALIQVKYGRTDERCLWRFLRLADTPLGQEEAFADFARRYGVLSLNEDGIPGGDPPERPDPDAPPPPRGPTVRRPDGTRVSLSRPSMWRREPLEAWRAWARHARLLIEFGLALRGDRRIEPRSLLRRYGVDPGPTGDDVQLDDDSPCLERDERGELRLSPYGEMLYRHLESAESLAHQRVVLAWEVQTRWTDLSEFALRLDWNGAVPRVLLDLDWRRRGHFVGPWCFPTLAGQLVATIASEQNVNHCYECGNPYPCIRRKPRGRCPECQRLERNRSVSRSKAKRKAAATPISTPIPVDDGG